MIMSFPDFGIYPEELRKANRLIISIAKNYNLTENDLDDADDIAKDIINRYANNNKRIAGYSNIEDALQKYHEQEKNQCGK